MRNIEEHLRRQVGIPEGKWVPGVYTNGFVSFTIQRIHGEEVLLYANSDIPYLGLSEDEALRIELEELTVLFGELLADFRLTWRHP